MTLPRASVKVGQPEFVTASRNVAASPRTSSGVMISSGPNTEVISASSAESSALSTCGGVAGALATALRNDSGTGNASDFTSTRIMIGKWVGLACDQLRTWVRQATKLRQCDE